jgi:hypothetical protein
MRVLYWEEQVLRKFGGVDGTRTPSASEEKRESFTPSCEAPPVTRDLRRDRQKR